MLGVSAVNLLGFPGGARLLAEDDRPFLMRLHQIICLQAVTSAHDSQRHGSLSRLKRPAFAVAGPDFTILDKFLFLTFFVGGGIILAVPR